ncbi:RPL6 [Symbiodinium microadriaticum]|nr:RPL6 [Symbiodinium microadriaticum]
MSVLVKKFAFKYEQNRAVASGASGKYYPAEDLVFKKGPTPVRNPPKVRASITPGTVLILLAGRFRGKRVVCLKTLSSGLLLVSGPYSLNGVPLRRVNQRYCIATSTNVPINGVDVSAIDDDFFKRDARAEDTPVEGRGTVTSDVRKAAQKAVDDKLIANVNKVDMLKAYLEAKFTLNRSSRPHAMQF